MSISESSINNAGAAGERGAGPQARFTVAEIDGGFVMAAEGAWVARWLGEIDARLRDFAVKTKGRELRIDVDRITAMDTAGAMVLQRTMSACDSRTVKSGFDGVRSAHASLLGQALEHLAPCETEPQRRNAFVLMLERLGRGASDAYFAALEVLAFIGRLWVTIANLIAHPRRFRLTSVFHHMEETGLDAVPIVGLISFLIGAVVAFMGARVLAQFGAEVFTVELIGISVLREFGVLLAAIMIAGRSGSAFTAQIGSMKNREEIDALRTLGLDPMEVLVAPRILALMVMLPALTFLADILGMFGGALVARLALEVSPGQFLNRTQEIIVLSNFWVGMIKAPFFAFIIGVIGCFQGLQVEGSAESVGQRTTLSVVQSIFAVIVLDAFFAMFFLVIDY
ncbi:MAG: ABC transporter permease [Pseudomonadota bacterium]